MAYIISDEELRTRLLEKYESLINSCKFFDTGKTFEAREISTKLRFLMHDTAKSTSLLKHLDKKLQIDFFDSGKDYDSENIIPLTALVAMRHDNGWSYVPKLGVAQDMKKIKFDTWWNKIIITDETNLFSRGDIILEIANKDGGAHIDKDKKLEENYTALSRQNSVGWTIGSKGELIHPLGNKDASKGTLRDLPDIHLVSVRQIAHETIISLGEGFPETRDSYMSYLEHILTL